MQQTIKTKWIVTVLALGSVTASFPALGQPVAPALNVPGPPPTTGMVLFDFPGLNNLPAISNYNYVRTIVPDVPVPDLQGNFHFRQTTSYFDGLGRPLQTVSRKAQGGEYDLIDHHVYDSLGREQYRYLPFAGLKYPNLHTNGLFKRDVRTLVAAFYNSDGLGEEPYSKTVYDDSPLQRVVKSMAPGRSWVRFSRGVAFTYKTNGLWQYQTQMNAYGVAGAYPRWTIGAGLNAVPQYQGSYANGELAIVTTTDEDGKSTMEAKDKQGRVVIKMASLVEGPINYTHFKDWAYTFYIYDDLGRLRCVVPPEAARPQPVTNSLNVTWAVSQQKVDNLCYGYIYDERGRLVEKKIPGKAVEYYVYDKRDRLIMYQDGNLRAQPLAQWQFTYYDALDREAYRAICKANESRAQMVELIENTAVYPYHHWLFYFKNYELYNIYPDPQGLVNTQIISYNYYDDYDRLSALPFDGSQFNDPANNGAPYISTQPYLVQPQVSYQTRGMLTGTGTRVSDPETNGWSDDWLHTAVYYDQQGRVIQTQSENLKSGIDISSNIYYFQGMLWKNILRHYNGEAEAIPGANDGALAEQRFVKTFERNIGLSGGNDMVKLVTQRINEGIEYPFAYYGYDHMNRVVIKQFPVGTVKQDYNIRGFLEHIEFDSQNADPAYGNTVLFDEKISYDRGFGSKLYNGNIAGITWNGADGVKKAYGYSYDMLNRLNHAEFVEQVGGSWNKLTHDYTTSAITYDLNGNIKSMNHKVPVPGAGQLNMDLLTYDYHDNSNQLKKVTDGSQDAIPASYPDFKDSVNAPVEYYYDANGNMVIDENKRITNITYNYLNKPDKITVNNSQTIRYVYDAAGNRLRKTITDPSNPSVDAVYDYIGNFVYKNNELQYVLNEEGRARPLADSSTGHLTKFVYDYFIKDHLGNVRSTVTARPMTMQYLARHEVASANVEQLLFDNIPNVRAVNPDGSPGNQMAALLVAEDPERRVGTAIMLRTMPGDHFTVKVQGYYEGTYQEEQTVSGSDVLESLMTTLLGGSTYVGVPVSELTDNQKMITEALGNAELASLIEQLPVTNADPLAPRAYLNYLFFDDNRQLRPEHSGRVQVKANSNVPFWQELSANDVNNHVSCAHCGPGFFVVYLDNRSIGQDVWFDDLFLGHYTSEVLEESHYYPFGLTITDENTTGVVENPYKLTTKELERSFRIEMYDFGARNYDPQLGRWFGIDPLADRYFSFSPYNYCANNPTRYVDLDGRKIDPASQVEVDQMKLDISQKNIEILGKQNSITAAATDMSGNINYSPSQNSEISELKFREGELSTAASELTNMESDQKMTFRLNGVSGAIATLSQNAGDLKNNIYTLNYIKGDVGNQIHEVIKHGAQILRGEIMYTADQSGNVTASTKLGFNNIGLEISAYKAQYSYVGMLKMYTEPATGSKEAQMNTLMQSTGTPNQINSNTTITNSSQINSTLIKSMMETAIGNIKIY